MKNIALAATSITLLVIFLTTSNLLPTICAALQQLTSIPQ